MFGWMRGRAVPRGLLRYYVLESLSEKPMSGSELMDEIERRSEGCWRPSPGSIYPLLAWLQDTGHVEEMPRDKSGMRRYRLTRTGKKLLQEERRVWTRVGKGANFFVHPFGPPWHRLPPEKTAEVRRAMRRVVVAFMEAMGTLAEEASGEALEGMRRILEETAERFEEMSRKLREGKK
ncbi:MAG: PadR family transcriptional regulator [Candidatus Hadarchaeales archaeon]